MVKDLTNDSINSTADSIINGSAYAAMMDSEIIRAVDGATHRDTDKKDRHRAESRRY